MTQDPRLTKIRQSLKTIKDKETAEKKEQQDRYDDSEAMSVGLRAGAELVTSVIAGGLIGYFLDIWLDTKPIFLIALFILGVITGFVNVWRTTQNIGYQVGYKNTEENDKNNDKGT